MIDPLEHTRVLDVSRYQGDINAVQIKDSGVVGVYAKACEWFWWNSDPRYKDPFWDANADRISDAGMFLGAYEYYRSKDRKPLEQAQWFREVVGDHKTDFIVIDVEQKELTSVWQFTEDLIKHTEAVQDLFGVVPWIYTRKTFWDFAIAPAISYDWHLHPLIAAHYNLYRTGPWIPREWEEHGEREVLWQISERWRNPGVSSNVDLNLAMEPTAFFDLMGASPPMTLEEKVQSLENRVAILEEIHRE